MIAAVVGILVVIFILFSAKRRPVKAAATKALVRKEKLPCPLCGTRLYEGERIRSIAYDLGEEKLMQIYGCPHCDTARGARRRCPVCRRDILAAGYVVGRMWNKKGKTRLHIAGCTECRPGYKETMRSVT